MIHCGTIKLETKRLTLRKIRLTDASPMFNTWASDSEVTRYLTWMAHDNVSVTQMIVNMWVNGYKNPNFYQWGITLTDTGKLIGTIGAVKVDENTNSIEIGYAIGKKYWNNGYTTEALEAIINFFFDQVGVDKVCARHDQNNPASGKVMIKCNMHYTHSTIEKNNSSDNCTCLNYEISRGER